MEEKSLTRIRKLKTEARTRKWKKYRWLILAALTILLVFSLYQIRKSVTEFLWNLDLFRLKEVKVCPENMTALVTESLGLEKPNNLLFLDLDEVHRKVSQLPIVERCRIRKILPSTLEIEVDVRKPWVRLPGNPAVFLDRTGALVPGPDVPDAYLRVSGIGVQNGAVRPADVEKVRILGEIEKWYNAYSLASLFPVQEVDLSDLKKIVLRGDSGEVYLHFENFPEKLGLLKTVLQNCQQRGFVWKYIDLRFREPYVKKTAKPAGN